MANRKQTQDAPQHAKLPAQVPVLLLKLGALRLSHLGSTFQEADPPAYSIQTNTQRTHLHFLHIMQPCHVQCSMDTHTLNPCCQPFAKVYNVSPPILASWPECKVSRRTGHSLTLSRRVQSALLLCSTTCTK
jgi:hypothetical protein